MNLHMEYAWGGTSREPVIVIYEDGRRVASFDTEAEADAWVRAEYGDDAADGIEIR